MNVGEVLKKVGTGLLKSNPLGRVIYDIADAVLDDDIPEDVTGVDLDKMLSTLPNDQYTRIIEKKLDKEVQMKQIWADVQMNQNEHKSPAREFGVKVMIVVIAVICVVFTLILGHKYLETGETPSIEMAMIIFGIPTLLLAGFFGISTDKIVDFVLSIAMRRYTKM